MINLVVHFKIKFRYMKLKTNIFPKMKPLSQELDLHKEFSNNKLFYSMYKASKRFSAVLCNNEMMTCSMNKKV